MSSIVHYRADIDGLRAIAVVSVVLYHFGIIGFSGGYVGVDIFFAISGYLIGSIVFKQLDRQQFSFSTFYIRRIRRLFPAYLVVIVVTYGLSYWLLLPGDFREFGQSIVAATVYASNILFYMETGYFDAASHLKPLLHTWSLAVEEQFYLVFPLLAWLIFRYAKHLAVVLFAVLCLASFIAAVIFIKYDHSAVFYLYPFRAWEMFLGVLLAAVAPRSIGNAATNNFLATAGLAAMLLPIALYTHETTFPGLAALPPCLGALLIIYTGSTHRGWVYQLLATKPFVFIGKISYSLYLWHWPLFVLYSYTREDPLTTYDAVLLIAATLIFSIMSWKFVETPFRTPGTSRFSGKIPSFAATALASALCIAVGLQIHITNGMPSRLSPELAHLATLADGFNNDWSNCVTQDNPDFPGLEHCTVGNPVTAKNMLLVWGDSHAPALKKGFGDLANDYHQDALIVWRGGCPPVWGIEKDESGSSAIEDQRCTTQNNGVRELIDNNKNIKAVVLVGRWSYYLNGGGVGIDNHNKIVITPIDQNIDPTLSQQELFLTSLKDTVTTLINQNLKVFIVEQPPEFANYHSRSIARALKNGSADYTETLALFSNENYADITRRQLPMKNFLTEAVKDINLEILPTHSYFCNDVKCSLLLDGRPAYYDNNHISVDTSLKINRLFTPVMEFMRAIRGAPQT